VLRRIAVLLVIIALFLAAGFIQERAGLIAGKTSSILNRKPASTTPPASKAPQVITYTPASSTKLTSESMMTLYYREANAMFLVPVSRSVPKTVAVIKTAAQELFAGPAKSSGLYASCPALTVSALTLKADGTLVVDLPDNAVVAAGTGMGSAGSAMAMDAIMYTLSEFDVVKRVQFLCGGKAVSTVFHGIAADKPFAACPYRSEGGEAVLYMVLYAGSRAYLVPERVNLGLGPNVATPDAIKAALDGLRKEVKRGDYKLSPAVPTEVAFNSVKVKDRLVTVDCNAKLLTAFVSDAARRALMLDAIIFTATAFPQVGSVQLTVDGRVVDQNIGQINIGKPLTRPKWINPEPRTTGGA
jgi:spore germination protein GerM